MSDVFEQAIVEDADADVANTRAAFLQAVAEEQARGKTFPRVAEAVGVPYATLQAWSRDKYAGNNQNIAQKVRAFLLVRTARAQTQAAIRSVPGFLMTSTSARILDALEFAQTAPATVVVSMASGLGKTTTVEAYESKASNVWLLTAQPSMTTPGALLGMLGMKVLGIDRGSGAIWRMSYAIEQRLRGTLGLVIVDEAQHLNQDVRDQLRQTVYDGAGIGVALVGSEALNETLARERSRGRNAQIISRIGQRLMRDRPTKTDVEMLLGGWKIVNSEVREMAMGIAMKPGALRQMTMALRIACALSDARGDDEPAPDDLTRAWKQLGGV